MRIHHGVSHSGDIQDTAPVTQERPIHRRLSTLGTKYGNIVRNRLLLWIANVLSRCWLNLMMMKICWELLWKYYPRLYSLLAVYYVPSSVLTQIYSGAVLEPNCPHQQINIRPKIATKIYSRAICLYWVSPGDWCFCCSVQARHALTGRPPYPGHDDRQSRFVKTRTSLLTDWALSRCDDIICDGQCLSQLEASVSNCD